MYSTLYLNKNTNCASVFYFVVAIVAYSHFCLCIIIQICESFREISYKLRERANSAEELIEQREFLETVPDMVATHQTRIHQAMSDYDLIEEYYYTLSDEDFNNRYVANYFLNTHY